jgi:GxxExxY protein
LAEFAMPIGLADCRNIIILSKTREIFVTKSGRVLCLGPADVGTFDLKDIDALTEKIIGCGIAVHTALGPGLLESIYRECMVIEFRAAGLRAEAERRMGLTYRGELVPTKLKLDLLVQSCVVVEVKAVERIHPIHLAQVITYLKLADCPIGLLMNFNTTSLRGGLRRVTHPSLYRRKG